MKDQNTPTNTLATGMKVEAVKMENLKCNLCGETFPSIVNHQCRTYTQAEVDQMVSEAVNKARIEELDRLFTTKRINDEQIVNQATFEYILDRIGELETPNQVEVMCTACSGSGIGASGDSNSTCMECDGDGAVIDVETPEERKKRLSEDTGEWVH